ncbi:MAG: thioredoxin family protein [Chitinophagales bacterium]
MAAETTKIELGYTAPDFKLLDTVTDELKSLADVKGEKATVVMFICNHCPYVIHIYKELIKVANEYRPKGVGFIAISSNDIIHYPADSPDKMKKFATSTGFPFPYLYDESQEVAKAYHASCTPDISVFDSHLKCVYRGRLDASTHKNDNVNDGKDLRNALDAILANQPISEPQYPSIGCSIKWKAE